MKNQRVILPALLSALLLFIANQPAYSGSSTWNLNPPTTEWTRPTNWTPNIVPNGPEDIATFDVSSVTRALITRDIEVNSIVFNPGASAYTLEFGRTPITLTLSGAGVVNNSAQTQAFLQRRYHTLAFTNSATAGSNTVFTLGGMVSFHGASSAGQATFRNIWGVIQFYDNSTAAFATFVNGGFDQPVRTLDEIYFNDTSSAGNAVFINNGASSSDLENNGFVSIGASATASDATFINNPSQVPGGSWGATSLAGTAGTATFIAKGSSLAGAAPGALYLFGEAGSGSCTATGGVNGGEGGSIFCGVSSDGSNARFILLGNGSLDQSVHYSPGLTIGSLEGNGLVYLAQPDFGPKTLIIGANNLDTIFAGIIANGIDVDAPAGSLAKIGTGMLTLSGPNTYTGGTTVSAGTLVVANRSGSGTGTGAVSVNAGTLGGSGVISGAVTVSAGAFLAPAHGNKTQSTLMIQSALTFNAGSTYTYTFQAKGKQAKADKVVANGVTIASGASFNLSGTTKGTLTSGLVLTVISNTSGIAISGTFSNLADGAIISVNGNNLQASYSGGDGNDLTLTVVR
ncbi:MAG: autotransporter-associated beta strand repeat-containing protein [Chthoniobacterales bacterium]